MARRRRTPQQETTQQETTQQETPQQEPDDLPTSVKRIVHDATEPWTIRITAETVKNAKRSDSQNCVVAQGIRAALGPFTIAGFEGMVVGPHVTKVYLNGYEFRYSTPTVLRQSIRTFDVTGKWNLPLGEITLQPLPYSLQLGYAGPSRRYKKRVRSNRPGVAKPRLPMTRTMMRSGTCPADYFKK